MASVLNNETARAQGLLGLRPTEFRMSSSNHILPHGTQSSSVMHSSTMPSEYNPEFLTFSCDGVACAAPLAAIREALNSIPVIASLPDSPAWFLGVFQLRAEILGAADIRTLLTAYAGVGGATSTDDTYPALTGRERAIVVGTGARSLALLVESIGDILTLQPHEILRDLVEHPAFGPIAPRYRLGLLAPDVHQTRFALVALDSLLTDIINALTISEVASDG
jgi:chemotaxis signal transduction protein